MHITADNSHVNFKLIAAQCNYLIFIHHRLIIKNLMHETTGNLNNLFKQGLLLCYGQN